MHGLLASGLVIGTSVVVEFASGMKEESIFDLLTNFAIFSASIFYLLSVIAVPILRWREPKARRPFRLWGHSTIPFLFIAAYTWFLVQVYLARPFESHVGLLFIILGLPVYWWLTFKSLLFEYMRRFLNK
jgi:APA family basic amino acid/polyamine antiporter